MNIPLLKIDRNHKVNSSDIIFLKANINYTEIHLQNGKKFILAKTLKRFQEDYEQFGFVRISRSVIVNMEFVAKTGNQFENLKLKNKIQFKVSRRRRENLKRIIVQ
ncbi:MAG: LytTR family transcriptional regulator DNA-binding domain-containing protein [Cytophagaceae bacterium]|nr:LytTR family transcriptional regulator DNA-binding domain-containing protein [Cytophagaceae bacterium]MBK9508794.1 LytTR family transcriptional regulator DNA-binding domain-containing protein [Cytophagaceae bacterium]MBK9935699.1 LytTR family transcriptional regulator DNA-binding domain-containing protein [Cytophagaceae bacterium]MBL0302140.1 LytTR family transcriptional regulator DNA-binding domain-containing protein [Cytophagaceae bacterium]MBL0324960.1 LytTR family transcriptional regulat